MNGLELNVARKMLGISVNEAALHIGNIKPRAWSYLEDENSDHAEVYPDVAQKITQLIERRRAIIKSVQEHNPNKVALVYYTDENDCADIIEYRFSQSLAQTLAVDYGVTLIRFNREKYASFLHQHNLQDNQSSRSYWAIEEKLHATKQKAEVTELETLLDSSLNALNSTFKEYGYTDAPLKAIQSKITDLTRFNATSRIELGNAVRAYFDDKPLSLLERSERVSHVITLFEDYLLKKSKLHTLKTELFSVISL